MLDDSVHFIKIVLIAMTVHQLYKSKKISNEKVSDRHFQMALSLISICLFFVGLRPNLVLRDIDVEPYYYLVSAATEAERFAAIFDGFLMMTIPLAASIVMKFK